MVCRGGRAEPALAAPTGLSNVTTPRGTNRRSSWPLGTLRRAIGPPVFMLHASIYDCFPKSLRHCVYGNRSYVLSYARPLRHLTPTEPETLLCRRAPLQATFLRGPTRIWVQIHKRCNEPFWRAVLAGIGPAPNWTKNKPKLGTPQPQDLPLTRALRAPYAHLTPKSLLRGQPEGGNSS